MRHCQTPPPTQALSPPSPSPSFTPTIRVSPRKHPTPPRPNFEPSEELHPTPRQHLRLADQRFIRKLLIPSPVRADLEDGWVPVENFDETEEIATRVADLKAFDATTLPSPFESPASSNLSLIGWGDSRQNIDHRTTSSTSVDTASSSEFETTLERYDTRSTSTIMTESHWDLTPSNLSFLHGQSSSSFPDSHS